MERRFLVLGLIILVVCATAAAFPSLSARILAADGADIEAVVTGNNAFAFDLYRKLAQEGGNLFFSPYSISSALAMTYAGARGETARQMASVLHFGVPNERLHATFASLTEIFNASEKSYQLAVANSLWGQIGYPFLPEFLGLVNNYYDAGFNEVDYVDDENRERARKTINEWVERTHHSG